MAPSGPQRPSPPCIHAVLVFYVESVLVYVITNIWQTWLYVTPKDNLYWSFGVFWWLILLEASHHIIRTFSQPYGETCRQRTEMSHQQSTPTSQPQKLLMEDPPASVKPSDHCSPSWHLTTVGAFKQEQSNHAVLKCLTSRNSDRQ